MTGNILRIGRCQHLFFISERSRLPVVIPIREAKRLGAAFPDPVCEMLAIVGVAAGNIANERTQMSEIETGRERKRWQSSQRDITGMSRNQQPDRSSDRKLPRSPDTQK